MTHIEKLLDIMRQLRDPKTGCEWDKKQNFASIAPYTIEEAYEVLDAIQRGHMDDLCEELGDLLLQVVFHSQMASEMGHFTFDNVAASICAKLERRHPHIFGAQQGGSGIDANSVKHNWEEQKKQEKIGAGKGDDSLLADIPISLPALQKAMKIQSRVATVGFEWPDYIGALDKIKEEIRELEAELPQNKTDKIQSEIGDLLFSICNLAKYFNVSPELALAETNNKFINRFQYIENKLKSSNQDISSKSLEELDQLWNEAKKSNV